MKYSALLIAASAGVASAARAMCSSGNTVTDTINNFYCDKVKGLSFTNVGHPSTGQGVKKMSGSGCEKGPMPIAGPMAPLDQDVRASLGVESVVHVWMGGLTCVRSRSTSAAPSA